MRDTEHKIVKNTAMLYILNIAKIFFPIIVLPYLTRVLSVEMFGLVAYVKAVMQYMQMIVDFGFYLSGTRDIATIGNNNREKLNHEISNIFIARLLLGFCSFGIVVVLCLSITLLKTNILFTFLSYLSVFLTVFLMDFYFQGIERMEIITIRFIVMKSISTILTFMFVQGDYDVIWIPVLDILGTIIAIILVWIQLHKMNICLKPQGISYALKKIKEAAPYFISNISTTAYGALNTLLIGSFLNTVSVAYWSLCMQLIGGIQSFYTPVTSGIYPHMMRTKDRGLIQKTIKIFIPLITIGCLVSFFSAKYVLLFVGGSKYVHAESLFRLLIPILFFSFPVMLYGWPVLGAIGKQKEIMMTTIISGLVQVVFLIFLLIFGNFNLVTIAIARDFTEALLFFLRFGLYLKYERYFL